MMWIEYYGLNWNCKHKKIKKGQWTEALYLLGPKEGEDTKTDDE